MHKVILKYNFRTESGKIEEKQRSDPKTFPSSCGITFEKRNQMSVMGYTRMINYRQVCVVLIYYDRVRVS